jgi:endonuclease YncB( thermonuclease family)
MNGSSSPRLKVDGQNLNLDLVRKALSLYYTKYRKSQKYDAEFRTSEKRDRKNRLTIWRDPELTKKYLRPKPKWGQRSTQYTKV